jgi:hypothetical protein
MCGKAISLKFCKAAKSFSIRGQRNKDWEGKTNVTIQERARELAQLIYSKSLVPWQIENELIHFAEFVRLNSQSYISPSDALKQAGQA